MAEKFVSCDLEEILVGETLPTDVYIYLDFRFITFRAAGDVIDRSTYERLELRKVRNLFIVENDLKKFRAWSSKQAEEAAPPLQPENREFKQAREEAKRKALDIFQSQHPDKIVAQSIESSKKLVTEVMKFPYAVQTLAQLQTYSKGTVDHSVNVSVLSVYLAMQMGYSHQLILQHVGMGGLLHDIGKTRVELGENDDAATQATKMREHAEYGLRILEGQQKVPNEVKMIVAQHHEHFDGTGFPKKLRGNNIYDLARIVAIANVFDELVADGSGALVERQRNAIKQLDEVHFKKFDPQKLDKSLKILKLGV